MKPNLAKFIKPNLLAKFETLLLNNTDQMCSIETILANLAPLDHQAQWPFRSPSFLGFVAVL